MATLRIEHAIHDYDLWQQAFDSFEQARAKAGVRSFAIRQPVNDPKYLMLDLEFDTQGQAESFACFLHDRVLVVANVLPRAGWPSADQDSRPPAKAGMHLSLGGQITLVKHRPADPDHQLPFGQVDLGALLSQPERAGQVTPGECCVELGPRRSAEVRGH